MSLKFAEFFAGVGLVRLGLAESGWTCVWANDISADKANCYRDNFGGRHLHEGDIWDWPANANEIPQDCTLYTASFPCTDLSLAGARLGLAGKESGALHAFLEILRRRTRLPPLILLENVSGFLSSHGGRDVALTVEALNQCGYTVDLLELDAVHFVPQSRPRVFLVGMQPAIATTHMDQRLGYGHGPLAQKVFSANPHLQWGHVNLPAPPARNSQLADIVEPFAEDDPRWWNSERKEKLWAQMFPRHQSVIQLMATRPTFSYATVFRRMREGISRAEVRADGIAGCLRTPRGGSSKQILIQAGAGKWSVRLLTPREYARLQGVPDSFRLPDAENPALFAMGDAVCVPLIAWLGRHVLAPAALSLA